MGADSRQIVVVHQRESFHRGFGQFLKDSWTSRIILTSFVRKELMVRYRESVLGVLWALVKPLTQLFIFGVVLGLFLGFGRSIPYYPLFILTGLIMMGIFNESATQGATSIFRGAPLVKKVAFRRELLPIAAVGGALINSFFQFVALCIGYLLTGSHPNWGSLGYAVPALLIVTLVGTGMALLLSALNVYLRDVQFIVDVGLMVMFWMTPVLYSWHHVKDNLAAAGFAPWVFELYMLNPMANSVLAFRQAFWPGMQTSMGPSYAYFDSPFAARLWLMVAGCAAFVWFAQRVFARMQTGFAAEL
ncbi:MAG: ABC transporter permease [Candidatus Nanopelagicales bacterium]